ncbi:MAG: class I SAM-dependent methyltransferase [Armatimonadetes bacterium]|nr:class I SAM-dependent methyltransferase [Armatimonadota bacterium]
MKTDPREQFGREAEKYVTSSVHADASALAFLIGLVQPRGGKIVDVGTGAGHTAFAFAPLVDEVTALDPTPEMLSLVERQAQEKGIANVSTKLGFAEELPFQDASIDGVTCRVAAHHFDDPERFVKEVARVLRLGGWFLLVDTVAPEDETADKLVNEAETIRDPSHRRNWKVSEWRARVQDSRLDVVTVETRWKRLALQEWMDRMSVSPADQAELRERIEGSSGAARDYFQPGDDSFSLLEMTLLARKEG